MLFNELSSSVLAVLLLVSCAVKHMAMFRIAQTQWFQDKIQGPEWWHAILFMSACGALMILTVIYKIVSWPKATFLAGLDFLLNMTAGWFAHRIDLFNLEESEKIRVIILIRTVYTFVYVSYVWECLG